MHIPTLRTDPADADAPSHRLLLRAVTSAADGRALLAVAAGVRVRAKVIGIIREEMAGIGAQEFVLRR